MSCFLPKLFDSTWSQEHLLKGQDSVFHHVCSFILFFPPLFTQQWLLSWGRKVSMEGSSTRKHFRWLSTWGSLDIKAACPQPPSSSPSPPCCISHYFPVLVGSFVFLFPAFSSICCSLFVILLSSLVFSHQARYVDPQQRWICCYQAVCDTSVIDNDQQIFLAPTGKVKVLAFIHFEVDVFLSPLPRMTPSLSRSHTPAFGALAQ